MGNLAAGYGVVGKIDKALPLLEKTVELMIAEFGPEHPLKLLAMSNLAQCYQSAGKMDKALPLMKKTLQMMTDKHGADHPDTLAAMSNLAWGYQLVGKLDQALPIFERAAAGIEQRRFQHESAINIITNTIEVYEQAKQYDKAEAWERKLLTVVKDQAGATSPAYAGELVALGKLLLNLQKWTEAETIVRECLTIREKTQPDVWTTFNTMSMLGGALLGQKKYAEAEPLLLKGYEGMRAREKTIPPQGQARLPEAIARLVQLYETKDEKEEAAKWRKELDVVKAAQKKTEKTP